MTRDIDFLAPVSKTAMEHFIPKSKRDIFKSIASEFNFLDVVRYLKPSKPIKGSSISYIPKIKARYYSLSTYLSNASTFQILFTKEVHTNSSVLPDFVLKKNGVCSHYISRLAESGDQFQLKLNKCSQFLPTPSDLTLPKIFISHGTAISPFLSILSSYNATNAELGSIYFYYG